MATYAIGDLQGCYQPLISLLQKINFDSHKDILWFTGDLINRGPQSLETIRFVMSLGEQHITVLGNHDLSFMAVAGGFKSVVPGDTLDDLLAADDKNVIVAWLRQRPLLYAEHNYVMTHAGIPPTWDLALAKKLSDEFSHVLVDDEKYISLMSDIYGNQPDRWDDNLRGVERWRCLLNYFTRMRFCYRDGRIDFDYKGEISDKPAELFPWFELPNRIPISQKIIFGHWSALNGQTNHPNIIALDTGCVWGQCLTAFRLDDGEYFRVECG